MHQDMTLQGLSQFQPPGVIFSLWADLHPGPKPNLVGQKVLGRLIALCRKSLT